MTTMTKSKTVTIKLSAWAVRLLIMFSALFSADGMGLVYSPNDIGSHTVIANILSNFVTVFNIFIMLFTALIAAFVVLIDDFIPKMVDDAVKVEGVEKFLFEMRFRKMLFLLVTLPFWGILVASGWFFTVLVWAALSAAANTMTYLMREYARSTYIKDTKVADDEKPSPNNDLLNNELG